MFERSFRALAHTADLGLEARGPTLESAFEQACEGMFVLMGKPQTNLGTEQARIEADGIDTGDLIVGLLSELLAHFELDERFLQQVHDLSIREPSAESELWTVALDATFRRIDRDHEPTLAEFKAVTYHQLAVERTPAGVCLRVIFDL